MDMLGLLDIPYWLLLTVVVLAAIYLYTTWPYSTWSRLGIPGPKPQYFHGNSKEVIKKTMLKAVDDWKTQYGRVFGDAQASDVHEEVAKDAGVVKFVTGGTRPAVVDKGLFFVGGPAWKRIRTLMTPAFTSSKLKHMCHYIQRCSRILEEILVEKSRREEPIDVKAVFGAFTMDVIAGTAFGLETNSQTREDEPFVVNCRKFFGMTREEVAGQGFVILMAGYETTSTTLQFLTYNLALHQDVQQRVYEEIIDTIGDADPTYDNVGGLKYLDSVIHETLRLFPPVAIQGPRLPLHCLYEERSTGEHGRRLEFWDVTIPAGCGVDVPIHNIMHDPEFFDDPDKFRPDRFSEENRVRMNPILLELVFGYGPRQCIGMRLALIEIKFAVVYFLRRLRPQLPLSLTHWVNVTMLSTFSTCAPRVLGAPAPLATASSHEWVLLGTQRYGTWNHGFFTSLGIPGPKPLPFLGNAMDFERKFTGNIRPPIVSKGLFFTRGSTWKRLRRLMTPTFTGGKLKNGNVQHKYDTVVGQSDICSFSVFGAFTMDVITGTAFGLETNSQTQPAEPFINLLGIYERKKSGGCKLKQTTDLKKTMFPFLSPLIRALGKGILSGEESDFLFNSVYRMVDERRQAIGDEKHPCSLTPGMTREEVAGQGFSILIAGYETTATTLQYLTYNLAKNQDVQQRVYEEMRDEMGDEDPTYDNVGRLKYLDTVIHETLRLFPPVSFITRQSLETRTIKGVTIPAGVGVAIPIYSIMHDPDYFDEPDTFWPERFSEAESSKLPRILSELPFGYGPRQCIGMRLALLEIKFAAVHILRHFRLLPSEDTPDKIEFVASLLTSPTKPLKLRTELRE
ncbi:hypothetical protein C0Q70_13342 [Pomacea canaliculata]|uniref:Cytochrome P450 n=1 Tax=Pomacea canaliculata TaxID=400727 RepID=A0A2T7NWZ5_POMCA|nr:hypothetical protein C0Q70_13342 [Pomacea canaliculata]